MSFVFDGGFGAEAGVDAAGVVGVFDPGGDPGVDLVAYGEDAPVVVLGCEGGPQGFSHPPSSRRVARAHRGGKRLVVGSAMTEILGVADPTRSSVTGHLAPAASLSNPTCHNPISRSFICG